MSDRKKRSIISKDYWISNGLSPEEAEIKVSELQKIRSPRCIEYWLKKTDNDLGLAQNALRLYQSERGSNISEERRRAINEGNPRARAFYEAQGLSKSATDLILSERNTYNIEYFVKTYGIDEGTRRHEKAKSALSSSVKKTLKNKRDLGIHDAPSSKWADGLITEIVQRYPGHHFHGKPYTNEFGAQNPTTGEYYFYDLVFPKLGQAFEFNGDFWHAREGLYEDDTRYAMWSNKTAAEIRAYDKRKLQTLETRGYSISVVWQTDIRNSKNREEFLQKLSGIL